MDNRVDFIAENYDKIIAQKGIKCQYEQAVVCQCITQDSGQPDFNCPICHGSGFRYMPKQDIRVVVSSFNSKVQSESLGIRESGTAYATPPSDIIMGFHDRLSFPDFVCKFSERLTFLPESKGVSPTTFKDLKQVIYLLKDDDMYQESMDFVVSDDRYHIKLLGEPPVTRVNMSILYMTTPSYLVVDLLHELRATYSVIKSTEEHFKELPKQYQLHREDFRYGISDSVPDDTTV